MAQDTAEKSILEKLAQTQTFHPAGAKLFVPDWTLDPGDVVTVTSKKDVHDPDEEPTEYRVPIYSMDLTWNGTSRLDIQSTGNQEREPLSALRRKEYQTGRRGYGMAKELDDSFKEFETWQTQTDEVIGTYAAQFVDILGDGTNEGRLTMAETAIEQTASDATITAQAAGILLDEDGHPVLDERGKYQYDPNAADTTLIAQINTNATEILAKVSQSDLNTTLSSYLQINAFSTELASTLDNGDTTLAAKIITAVNKNTNTSSVVISADQINLDGVVTAVFLDSRMANIDKLFTTEGTALEITAGTANIMNLNWLSGDSDSDAVGLKTIRVNGVAPTNIGFLGTGSDTILDINTVGIVSASVANNILTLTDTSGNTVNFSKATSVSGEWGSNQQGQPTGVFTVTATQTNRNTTTGQDETTTVGTVLTSVTQAGHWGNTSNQEDPNTYYQSTNATINTSQQLHTVKTAEINASSRYIAGQNSVVSTFTKAQSLPSGITPTDFNAGELWRYHVTKDGADVADAYYRVLNGGSGNYYATFLDTITLESTDISDSVTKYSIANYSDGHRDSEAKTRVVIDASAVYSAGVTAGLGGVVNVEKQPWDGNTCEFKPSAGEGTSASVTITAEPTKVSLASATSTGEIVLKDGSNQFATKNLYLRSRTLNGQNYVVLTDTSSIVSVGNVLAKYSASGGGGTGETRSVYNISDIVLSPADIGPSVTKYPTLYYDDETDDNTIPIYIDASAVYRRGQQDGAGITILDTYTTTIDSNNTTVTLLPSEKGDYNVMASARVTVNVPVHEGVQGATLLASTDSDTTWGGWQLDDYTQLGKKYGFIKITGKDGSTYSYGIDANDVYDAGVSEGAGVQIELTKAYGSTVTETGTYTINPSSGYAAMKKATFSVRVPTVPRIQKTLAYGTASIGTHTVYPDEDYDVMEKVTFTVPNVTVDTQRNQPTTGVTTTNIKVGNNIKVIVKFGNATIHQQIFAATN